MADKKKREPNAFERLIEQPKPKGPPAPPRQAKPAAPRNALGQQPPKFVEDIQRRAGFQGPQARRNQQAVDRAAATGDMRTLTQRALANPNTYESRVAQARRQLGIKPGTPDDELLKSALYLRIDNTGWEGRDQDGLLRIVPAESVREITRRMRNPKERQQLQAEVEARRAMREGVTPSQIRPATPEEAANMARRGQVSASEDALRASGAAQTRENIDRIAGEFTRPIMDALGTPIGRLAAGAFGALPREAQEGAVNLANEALNPLVFAPRTLQYGQELLSGGPVLPETRAGAAVGLAGSALAAVGYVKGLGAMFSRIAEAGADAGQIARTTEGARAMVDDLVRSGASRTEAVQAVQAIRRATPEELQGMVDELAQVTPPPAVADMLPAEVAARQVNEANQVQSVPQISAKNLTQQAQQAPATPAPLAEAAPAPQAPQAPDLPPSRAIPEQAAGQKEPWQMTREEYVSSNPPTKEDAAMMRQANRVVQLLEDAGWDMGRGAQIPVSGWRQIAKKARIANPFVFSTPNAQGIQVVDLANGMVGVTLKDTLPTRQHSAAVYEALQEGKPVPPEVLADYPDLAAKYGNQPNAIQEPQTAGGVLRQAERSQEAGQEAQVGLREVRQGQAEEVGQDIYLESRPGTIRAFTLGKGKKLPETATTETLVTRNGTIVEAGKARQEVKYDGEARDARVTEHEGVRLLSFYEPRDDGPNKWYVIEEDTKAFVSRGMSEAGALLRAKDYTGQQIAEAVAKFKAKGAAPTPAAPPKPKAPAPPKPPKPPAQKPKAVTPPPQEPNLIGFRHQDIEPRLKAAGIDPVAIERLGDAGMRKAAAEGGYVSRAGEIARRIVESRKGAVDAKEVLGMQMRRLDISVRQRALDKAIREAGDDVNKLIEIDEELAALGREIVDIDQAVRLSTSEAGRTLREAQMVVDETLDQVGIRNRWRGAARGDLPANVEAQVAVRAEAIAKAEEELSAAQSALSKLEKENADLRAKIKMAEADAALKGKNTPSRPRALKELEAKAASDFESWKKKFAKAGVKGGKQRGAAIDPALLYEGAYLYAKMMLVKGVRKLDDIIRGAKEEGIDLSREEMARAVERAADDLKPARKPTLKATMANLRAEIAQVKGKGAMLDEIGKARQAKLDEALKQVDELNTQLTRATTQEELDAIRDKLNKLGREIGPGKNFAEDGGAITVRRKNPETGKMETMELPQLQEARAKVRKARAKLDRERGKVKQMQDYLRGSAEYEAMSYWQKQGRNIVEGMVTMRSVMLSGDAGSAVRQGGFPLSFRPRRFFQFWKNMGRALWEEKFDDIMEAVMADEMYDDAIAAGLKVDANPEEDFQFNVFAYWAEGIDRSKWYSPYVGEHKSKQLFGKGPSLSIPWLKGKVLPAPKQAGIFLADKWLEANSRAYAGPLKTLRMGMFREYADMIHGGFAPQTQKVIESLPIPKKWKDALLDTAPVTAEEQRQIAEWVNDMTGATTFGKHDVHVNFVNKALISARYYGSRFKLLLTWLGRLAGAGKPLSPRVRRVVAAEYARFIAKQVVVLGTLHAIDSLALRPEQHKRRGELAKEVDQLRARVERLKGDRSQSATAMRRMLEQKEREFKIINDELALVDLDPRSTNFLTIKFGPYWRFESNAGLRPFANFTARMTTSLLNALMLPTSGNTGFQEIPNYKTRSGDFKLASDPQAAYAAPGMLMWNLILLRSNPPIRIVASNFAQEEQFQRETNIYREVGRSFLPLFLTQGFDAGQDKAKEMELFGGPADSPAAIAMQVLASLASFTGYLQSEQPQKVQQAIRDEKKLEKKREKQREELRNPGN